MSVPNYEEAVRAREKYLIENKTFVPDRLKKAIKQIKNP